MILDQLQSAIADRYKVERELGKGGMATVFLATDVRHERQVAIKVLHPDLAATIGAERFEREIKLAAKLQHPNILGLYDSGTANGLLYYVMPFIQGESVRDKLDREKQLSVDDAIQITLEVADALGYAHAQDIVHRDIKPENVMMSNGHALVADFGIARARTEAGQSKLTQTGMAVGTPVYMSPEQATGETVGPAADIYSLGCMLYEMLAGEPPFQGPNAMAIMARHAMEAVPSIRIIRPAVPEEVEEAIFHAMEKNVADRPKTLAEFCEIMGTPLGMTATRRVTGRHTARHRVPTGAAMPQYTTSEAQLATMKPKPLYKRPVVVGSAVLGLVAASWATYMGLSGRSANAAVGDVFNQKKVAVLYFEDRSGGTLGYLADNLTETIIDQLTKAGRGELEVLSKDAVGRFRGKTVSTDSVVKVLGEPGTVVRGSVSEDGGQVRVNVSAINANTDADLGPPLVLRLPADNGLALRQTVSDSVSGFLRRLLGAEIRARQLEAGTTNQVAWSNVQRAEKLRKDGAALPASDSAQKWLRYAQADSLLAQAEGLDKKWATPVALRAVVRLAEARAAKTPILKGPILNDGIDVATRALRVDSSDVDALEARGQLRYERWNTQLDDDKVGDKLLEGARDDLVRATDIEPTRATAWVTLATVQGQLHDQFSAYEAAKKAYDLDAFASFAEGVLRQMYATAYNIQQFTQAQKHCDEGLQRFPNNPNFISCQLTMRGTGQIPSTPDTAWQLLRRLNEVVPESQRELQRRRHEMFVAMVLANNKLKDSAIKVIEAARTNDPKIDPASNLLTAEALARLRLGTAQDTTIALEKLREYVIGQPLHGKGFADTDHWWWKDLRKDPRWDRMLRVRTGS